MEINLPPPFNQTTNIRVKSKTIGPYLAPVLPYYYCVKLIDG